MRNRMTIRPCNKCMDKFIEQFLPVITAQIDQVRSIGDAWAVFAQFTIPPGTSAAHRKDMRRSFYNGAAATWELLVRRAGGDDEFAINRLNALQAEFEAFALEIRTGEA